jgi:hypothetical protein
MPVSTVQKLVTASAKGSLKASGIMGTFSFPGWLRFTAANIVCLLLMIASCF